MKKKIAALKGVKELNRKEQRSIFAGARSCRNHRDCFEYDQNGQIIGAGICVRYTPYIGMCEF